MFFQNCIQSKYLTGESAILFAFPQKKSLWIKIFTFTENEHLWISDQTKN